MKLYLQKHGKYFVQPMFNIPQYEITYSHHKISLPRAVRTNIVSFRRTVMTWIDSLIDLSRLSKKRVLLH